MTTETTTYEGCKVYSVQLQNLVQLDALMNIGIDFWDSPNQVNKPFRVMVEPNALPIFEKIIEDHKIVADLIIEDAQSVLSQEILRNSTIPKREKNARRNSASFDHYFRFQEITEFLEDIVADHPELTTLESAGKTNEGRDLWLIKISNSGFDGTKPVIFIDSNSNAREWITVMTTLNLIQKLIDQADKYPEMLSVADWMIIPVSNPDGYEYSHTGNRLWRKTRSVHRDSTCLGTDPNRNFAYKWEVAASASDNPCSLLYRGPHAESEPEVAAISNLLREYKNRIKLYLSVHSFGDYLLFPFGYDYHVPNKNDCDLISVGIRAAWAIGNASVSRSFTVGNSATVLHAASGTSEDFAAGGDVGIDFAYTVVLSGGGSKGFDLEPENIQTCAKEIFAGYREYAIWVGERFK